jgi:2-polyprenyl-6-methoxyphenol hydroxylase-like FAD-dependent oxidoreductase
MRGIAADAACLIVGAEVTSADQSVPSRVPIPVGNGVLEADLVVAADEVGSRLRSELFPDHAGPVYSGSTVLRAITEHPMPLRTDSN